MMHKRIYIHTHTNIWIYTTHGFIHIFFVCLGFMAYQPLWVI